MSDEKKERDNRRVCRFGLKCYQKNATHQEQFIHPQKRPLLEEVDAAKKAKIDDEEIKVKPVTADKKKDISDDEDDDTSVRMKLLENRQKNKEDISDSSDSDSPPPKRFMKLNRETEDKEALSDSDDDMFPDADKYQKSVKDVPAETESSDENTNEESQEPKPITSVQLNPKEFIKSKFLVNMPDDFHQFWDFCNIIKRNKPEEALSDVGLTLVGPYDVLAGKFTSAKEKTDEEYLLHWRYYYDPPEFQTVLKGDDSTGFHIGYFRDDPAEDFVFMAANYAKTDGTLEVMGTNIFAAVSLYLDKLKKTGDPFKKMHVAKYQNLIEEQAEELKLDLEKKTPEIYNREKKIVTKTFHKLGLVVPFDKKSQLGYRELAMEDKELKSLLTKLSTALPEQKDKFLSDLQPVLTYASIAMDECDFGTGLELGLNIFSFGIDSLNQTASRFLANSYKLLKRDTFAKIAEAHMKNRKKGSRLSILY